MYKLVPIIFFLLFSINCSTAQSKSSEKKATYPYLHPEINVIQYTNQHDFSKFVSSWQDTLPHQVVILHCGDSHVQPDVLTSTLRNGLQKERGFGGRGLIFPYSIAKTYSAIDYKSRFSGEWSSSNSIRPVHKLPLGVSGFTALTLDQNASFTFHFKQPLPTTYKIIKIFYDKSFNSFDFNLEVDGKGVVVPFENQQSLKKPFIVVKVPEIKESIKLSVEKNGIEQEQFMFFGMSIESEKNDGVLVQNLGIGGAMYESILLQELFDKQFPALHADMIILDYGTNNYLYKDLIPSNMDSIIIETIRKVRLLDPDISILLTSSQDMFFRRRHITSGEIFSAQVKRLAFENHCLFYDWFWIAGGNRSMPLWQKDKIGRSDGVHLTVAGYTLKGEMFTEAILKALNQINLADTLPNPVIIPDAIYETLKKKEAEDAVRLKSKTEENTSTYHKIRKGETLSFIAKKYGTTTQKIMKDNKLKSANIKAGKTLIIKK